MTGMFEGLVGAYQDAGGVTRFQAHCRHCAWCGQPTRFLSVAFLESMAHDVRTCPSVYRPRHSLEAEAVMGRVGRALERQDPPPYPLVREVSPAIEGLEYCALFRPGAPDGD